MHPRIRDLRQDKDPNQTQIAKLLGMSQTGYSKYETGENDIPTAILIKPARFYNTSKDGEDAVATRGRNGFGSLLHFREQTAHLRMGLPRAIVNRPYLRTSSDSTPQGYGRDKTAKKFCGEIFVLRSEGVLTYVE